MHIVKSLNKKVLMTATKETVGFDSSLRLSKRTNSLFTSLLESWLVSDTTINYFCFDLCGFAFLLDTVGSDEPSAIKAIEESKDSAQKVPKKITSALAASDLDDLLTETSGSKDFVKSLSKVVKANEHPDWEVLALLQSLRSKTRDAAIDTESGEETKLSKEDLFKDGVAGDEPRFQIPIAELGKNMIL